MQDHDNQGECDGRGNVQFWLRWLTAAKKASENHRLDTDAAWAEYEDGIPSDSEETKKRLCPIYWSSCQTIESAYYSKTPKLKARRRFDIDDPVALTAALIVERLSEYLVENSYFDSVLRASVGNFLHSGKTTTQVCVEDVMGMQPVSVPLFRGDDGQFYEASEPEEGEAPEPYEGEVSQDEQGNFFGIDEEEVIQDRRITLKAVCHDEILHTPEAKSQDEITEIAYKFCLDEPEAKRRFTKVDANGEEIPLNLPFKQNKNYERGAGEENRSDIPGRFLEGWEIYDLKNHKVYWVCESYKEDFLDQKDDLYKLRNFFPSPGFVIASKPEKSMYPRPAYTRLQATLNQLHSLYERRFDLIQKIKRQALVDGSEEDVINALNSTESGGFIACKNLQSILNKGGIENVILWIDISQLIQAISEISAMEADFKNSFFEFFGIPDILRGVSDPQEALGTQQIKSSAAHDRFKNHKKQIQELARDSIELMLDLALEEFAPEKIFRICGLRFAPEHASRFMEALAFLKDDEERLIRIDIETDSTSFIDAQAELYKRKAISDTVISGLATIGGMQNPEFGSVALRVLLSTLSGIDGSKEFEDGVVGAVKELMARKAQPQEPAPDVKMLQVQVQQQKVQLDAEARGRELSLKEMQILGEQKQAQFERQLEVVKSELERQMQEFVQMTESARVELESVKVSLSEREKLIEEQRLALEAAVAAQEVPQAREPQAPQIIEVHPPAMPPINITVDNKAGGKKVGKITRDPMGNSVVEFAEVPDLGV